MFAVYCNRYVGMILLIYLNRIRRKQMGRLTFVFNQDKLNKAKKSENDMLSPMREYAKEYGIIETSTGVFEMEGNDAFALLGGFVADITDEDHTYVTFLDKWELDVGGIVDDCIEDTLDWYKEEGIAV
jgi:hypothetical protein